jgi:hypothetical protein
MNVKRESKAIAKKLELPEIPKIIKATNDWASIKGLPYSFGFISSLKRPYYEAFVDYGIEDIPDICWAENVQQTFIYLRKSFRDIPVEDCDIYANLVHELVHAKQMYFKYDNCPRRLNEEARRITEETGSAPLGTGSVVHPDEVEADRIAEQFTKEIWPNFHMGTHRAHLDKYTR